MSREGVAGRRRAEEGQVGTHDLRSTPRVLVAGVGNALLGDDGFGVEVARRLAMRRQPAGVTVRDFGIRGLDLAYELEGYDVLILVDTVPAADGPGTLHLLDASEAEPGPMTARTHGMDPVSVLGFARTLGRVPAKVYVLGCEAAFLPDPSGDEIVEGLSAPVRAALDGAVARVLELIDTFVGDMKTTVQPQEVGS